MKQVLFDNKDLWMKVEKIEQSLVKKDGEVKAIFKVLKKLLLQEDQPRNVFGFKIPKKKS